MTETMEKEIDGFRHALNIHRTQHININLYLEVRKTKTFQRDIGLEAPELKEAMLNTDIWRALVNGSGKL